MNDISVKIVESPKAGVEVSPVLDENEVDPLALDEELEKVKDVVEKPVVPVSCDENAKDEVTENQLEDCDSIALQVEKVKEELLKEDTNSLNSTIDENLASEPNSNDLEPASTSAEPTTSELPDPVKPDLETMIEKKEELAPEPSPVKEALTEQVEKKPDVEMTEVVPSVKNEVEKVVEKVQPSVPVNGDIAKEERTTKRRASEDVDTESPLKKLCQEVEKTFPQHDMVINEYIQTATKNNVEEIQRHTEQLLAEIQTLRELAQKKEHEWNNILHLKKVKEEILLRLLRRKQVLSYEKSGDVNGSDRSEPFDYINQAKSLAIDKSDEISGLSLKQTGSSINPMMQQPVMPVTSHYNPMSGLPPPYDKAAHMQMPKPVFQPMMMAGPIQVFPRDMNMNGQLPSYGMPMGRQGPTKDVKSIIADYRQRNPDITPRRGRRMKSIINPNMMNVPRPIAPKVDSMNNLSNLNMLFNNLDMNQKAMLERLQQIQAGGLPNSIFKDALVQFANMQQQANVSLLPNRPMEAMHRPEHHMKAERRRPERTHEDAPKHSDRLPSTSPRLPPPPPYPEISLLPVPTNQDGHTQQQNSLLHGILTKPALPTQSYSPTLAKLLTSPERRQSVPSLPTFGQAKNCGEITITPVQPAPQPQPEPQPPAAPTPQAEEVVQLDDEESPTSEGSAGGAGSPGAGGRLVIDEAGEAGEGGAAGEAAGGEGSDAPLCQGCRRRDAQFVCAGCANQWYCSRDCQVAAWDDHSEMCSG